MRGLRRAFSLGFQAGAIAVFIRWRAAADAAPDQARACGHGAADFYLVGGAPARRPSYGVRLRRRRRLQQHGMRGLRRAFSLGFQAGAIAVFIRWRAAADAAPDQARACGHGAADFYLVGGSAGAAAELWGRLRRPGRSQQHGLGVYAVLSLSDFRLARSRSLSVGARLPTPRRIRPERAATAPPISIWLAAAPARRPSYGVGFATRAIATARMRGLRRAFSLGFQAGAIAVFIRWRAAADAAPDQARACGHGAADFYLVGGSAGAAAELWGRLRHQGDRNSTDEGLRRAFSLGFQAGAIAVFIRWRAAADAAPDQAIIENKATANQSPLLRLCL